jgi:hypothetical protein
MRAQRKQKVPAKVQAGAKYRRVYWEKKCKKWTAAINYDGKRHHLGIFEDEKEAAKAYDRAARAHHGEKAGVLCCMPSGWYIIHTGSIR